MQDLKDFYTSRRKQHQQELQQVKKHLGLLATLRLSVFVGMGLGVYLLWGNVFIFVMLPLGIALFLYLVTRFSNVKRHKEYLERLIAINNTELDILDRKFYHLPDGKTFLQLDHPYAQDLDLFGRGSFFQ